MRENIPRRGEICVGGLDGPGRNGQGKGLHPALKDIDGLGSQAVA